ncbi:Re/Si-specific NAD(P)(+) transhydrogenase subunit alpha [Pannus brasiliensis CCIBt3594]|uniref:NAD(P) transhydrogenase subunit alpha part 1 n=1 Tax=Pannus brasiliensis CCIBt3594 TaxID=1427578 RepID=A0AAW9QXE7_9CHRO
MRVGIAKESELGEARVALVPDTVARLVKAGFEILVETGAGSGANFPDAAYRAVGATVIDDPYHLYQSIDILLKVAPPNEEEIDRLKSGTILIGFLDPLNDPYRVKKLADRQITAFSMELIPRSSRAQSMDALSSQANLAGYKAVLLAAVHLPKMFPMMTTAAGTIAPAKVLVLGAGVAGLQACATARRLGAVVEAFDIRPQVKEEVQSVGAKFIEMAIEEDTVGDNGYAKQVSSNTQERIWQTLAEPIKKADVVITTARVPGKQAPRLVTEEMIASMKPGSVIVDLAADQGGNCAYTSAGRNVIQNGVTIVGATNLPATVATNASQMYAKNLQTLLNLLVTKEGSLNLDFGDDILDSACCTHAGEIRNQRVKDSLVVSV